MDRAKGLFEGKMMRTLSREVISTRQEKLAELAQIEPKLVLTTLAHHIDEVWLREAYRRTRKDGAAGVDGVTAEQYEVARSVQDGSVSCAGGAPGAHPEAGNEEDTPYWYPDAGGQGIAASGADGVGAGLRARFYGLFVWIQAGA